MCAAKIGRLGVELLFRLTVEGRVDDQAVDEDPEIRFDLMWLDDQFLVFLLDGRHDLLHDLVHDVVDVCATFRRADGVDEGDLLEGAIAQTADHLPPL